jgi:hypothetical protein
MDLERGKAVGLTRDFKLDWLEVADVIHLHDMSSITSQVLPPSDLVVCQTEALESCNVIQC